MNHLPRFFVFLHLVIFGLLTVCACGATITAPDPAVQGPDPLWSVPISSADELDEYPVTISCSGDGDVVAAGYGAGIIEIRNRQGDLLGRWQSLQKYYTVWSLKISRDGRSLVAVLADPMQEHRGQAVYLNRSGGLLWQKPLRIWMGIADISVDGNTIAIADSNQICFYDQSGILTGSATLEEMIWSMALAGDGTMAVVVGIVNRDNTGSLYVVQRDGTSERIPVELKGRGYYSAALSGDGKYIAAADPDHLRIFTRNGTRIGIYNSSIPITSLAISSGGEAIVAGSQYYLWNFNTSGGIVWRYDAPDLPYRHGAYFGTVAVSDDGGYVTATGWGNRILFLDQNGTLLWENQSPSWMIEDLCLSGAGNSLAVGTPKDIRYFGTGIKEQTEREIPTAVSSSPHEQPDLPVTSQKAPVSAVSSVGGIIAGIFLIRMYRKRAG